ncbi:MAG: hypothetical protein ABIK89_25910 [Planctomycetota bacterium]
MIVARERSFRRHRRAVTLLEVLLVLCLLVALASIAWPALERPLSNQRLRKAADVVRIVWARARVEAMSSGRTLVFRYAVEGDRYSIRPHDGPEFAAGAESADGFENRIDAQGQSAAMFGYEPKLPEGMTFLSGETDDDTRADSLALDTTSSDDGGLGWSEPILFYPDGSASTTRLVLKSQYDRCVELSLRGLTGVVTVSETFSAEGGGL